jgi:hypothetical protein
MATQRISIDIDEEEHKYLKMCCLKLGMTIKEFAAQSIIESVDAWEDTWMLERWDKDGTREEINREMNDPNRTTYLMEKIDGKFFVTEMKGGIPVGSRYEV